METSVREARWLLFPLFAFSGVIAVAGLLLG
jgi:hypothetical protein